MKELSYDLVKRALRGHLDTAQVLSVSKLVLGKLGGRDNDLLVLPSVSKINLSGNYLTTLEFMWLRFPSIWWVDVSLNQIASIDTSNLPLALGSLNLVSNSFQIESICVLRPMHLLRLYLSRNEPVEFGLNNLMLRAYVITALPNVWVLDGDFISSKERSGVENITVPGVSDLVYASYNKKSAWDMRVANERESALLRVVQNFPVVGRLADSYRLDVLLEDYLEEARVFNKYGIGALQLEEERMPTVDIIHIMSLPHRQRLDLSVMFTAAVLFPLPQQLFKDALVVLLAPFMPIAEIVALVRLPTFVYTALVSVIRRVCVREQDELASLQALSPKPKHDDFPHLQAVNSEVPDTEDPPPTTYLHPTGFNFLRPFRVFVQRPLERTLIPSASSLSSIVADGTTAAAAAAASSQGVFSELEMEILKYLPDCPTKATCPPEESSSYKDWVSFVARHAVLLITKSPSCPSLTKAQTSKNSQESYVKLLPLLRAAKMTYDDLDLNLTGPEKDGRTKVGKNAGGGAKKSVLKDKETGIAGRALVYGVGLPGGRPEDLNWVANPPTEGRIATVLASMTCEEVLVEEEVEEREENILRGGEGEENVLRGFNDSYLSYQDAQGEGSVDYAPPSAQYRNNGSAATAAGSGAGSDGGLRHTLGMQSITSEIGLESSSFGPHSSGVDYDEAGLRMSLAYPVGASSVEDLRNSSSSIIQETAAVFGGTGLPPPVNAAAAAALSSRSTQDKGEKDVSSGLGISAPFDLALQGDVASITGVLADSRPAVDTEYQRNAVSLSLLTDNSQLPITTGGTILNIVQEESQLRRLPSSSSAVRKSSPGASASGIGYEESEDELTLYSGFPSDKPPRLIKSPASLEGVGSDYLTGDSIFSRDGPPPPIIEYAIAPEEIASTGEEMKSLRRLARKDAEQQASLGRSHLSSLLEFDHPHTAGGDHVMFAYGRPESRGASETVALTYSPPKKEIMMERRKATLTDSIATTSRAQSPKQQDHTVANRGGGGGGGGGEFDVVQHAPSHQAPSPNSRYFFDDPADEQQEEGGFQMKSRTYNKKTTTTTTVVLRKRATHAFLKAGGGGNKPSNVTKGEVPFQQVLPRTSTQAPVAYAPSSVGGFSADANWKSSFLLAPTGAIVQYNSQQADDIQKWEEVSRPPVLMYPHTHALASSNAPVATVTSTVIVAPSQVGQLDKVVGAAVRTTGPALMHALSQSAMGDSTNSSSHALVPPTSGGGGEPPSVLYDMGGGGGSSSPVQVRLMTQGGVVVEGLTQELLQQQLYAGGVSSALAQENNSSRTPLVMIPKLAAAETSEALPVVLSLSENVDTRGIICFPFPRGSLVADDMSDSSSVVDDFSLTDDDSVGSHTAHHHGGDGGGGNGNNKSIGGRKKNHNYRNSRHRKVLPSGDQHDDNSRNNHHHHHHNAAIEGGAAAILSSGRSPLMELNSDQQNITGLNNDGFGDEQIASAESVLAGIDPDPDPANFNSESYTVDNRLDSRVADNDHVVNVASSSSAEQQDLKKGIEIYPTDNVTKFVETVDAGILEDHASLSSSQVSVSVSMQGSYTTKGSSSGVSQNQKWQQHSTISVTASEMMEEEKLLVRLMQDKDGTGALPPDYVYDVSDQSLKASEDRGERIDQDPNQGDAAASVTVTGIPASSTEGGGDSARYSNHLLLPSSPPRSGSMEELEDVLFEAGAEEHRFKSWEGCDEEYLDQQYDMYLKGTTGELAAVNRPSEKLQESLRRRPPTLREKIAEASKALLIEMGTIKNIRRLNEIERRRFLSSNIQPIKNRTTKPELPIVNPITMLSKSFDLVPALAPSQLDSSLVSRQIAAVSDHKLSWGRMASDWNQQSKQQVQVRSEKKAFLQAILDNNRAAGRGGDSKQKPAKKAEEEATFLTNIAQEYEQEQEEQQEGEADHHPKHPPSPSSFPPVVSPGERINVDTPSFDLAAYTKQNEPVIMVLTQSLSATDLMKLRSNYDKIYTYTQGVEPGGTTITGKSVAPTWYPKYSKVVYTLESNALTRAVGEVTRAANAFNTSSGARIGNLSALHIQPTVDVTSAASSMLVTSFNKHHHANKNERRSLQRSPSSPPHSRRDNNSSSSPQMNKKKKADNNNSFVQSADVPDKMDDDLDDRSQYSIDEKGRPIITPSATHLLHESYKTAIVSSGHNRTGITQIIDETASQANLNAVLSLSDAQSSSLSYSLALTTPRTRRPRSSSKRDKKTEESHVITSRTGKVLHRSASNKLELNASFRVAMRSQKREEKRNESGGIVFDSAGVGQLVIGKPEEPPKPQRTKKSIKVDIIDRAKLPCGGALWGSIGGGASVDSYLTQDGAPLGPIRDAPRISTQAGSSFHTIANKNKNKSPTPSIRSSQAVDQFQALVKSPPENNRTRNNVGTTASIGGASSVQSFSSRVGADGGGGASIKALDDHSAANISVSGGSGSVRTATVRIVSVKMMTHSRDTSAKHKKKSRSRHSSARASGNHTSRSRSSGSDYDSEGSGGSISDGSSFSDSEFNRSSRRKSSSSKPNSTRKEEAEGEGGGEEDIEAKLGGKDKDKGGAETDNAKVVVAEAARRASVPRPAMSETDDITAAAISSLKITIQGNEEKEKDRGFLPDIKSTMSSRKSSVQLL